MSTKISDESFVECARCGDRVLYADAVVEEGDEWECFPCNDRENERERLNLLRANHQESGK